ncbi:MAG: phospholipid carrier-dependent glycosyltransferase, partial [Gammaproteobacteria bacterium]
LAGIGLVWLGYLAISPNLQFQTTFYDRWADRATGLTAFIIDRLPFPEAYRVGIRFAAAFDLCGTRAAFLLGETYSGGRFSFYPVILALKTPLGTLSLWAAGIVTILGRARRADVLWVLVPIPATVLVASMASNTNIGIRHIAVVPMFAAIVAGGLVVRFRNRRAAGAVVLLIALTAVSVWRTFPSQLSYVNEAFGGPSNAHNLVADSNVDWGQDLGRLARYLASHPTKQPVWLMYFGSADPAAYGIKAQNARNADRGDIHGFVAISVSWLNLAPSSWYWIVEQGSLQARVGDTILIYEVP